MTNNNDFRDDTKIREDKEKFLNNLKSYIVTGNLDTLRTTIVCLMKYIKYYRINTDKSYFKWLYILDRLYLNYNINDENFQKIYHLMKLPLKKETYYLKYNSMNHNDFIDFIFARSLMTFGRKDVLCINFTNTEDLSISFPNCECCPFTISDCNITTYCKGFNKNIFDNFNTLIERYFSLGINLFQFYYANKYVLRNSKEIIPVDDHILTLLTFLNIDKYTLTNVNIIKNILEKHFKDIKTSNNEKNTFGYYKYYLENLVKIGEIEPLILTDYE